MANKWEKIHQEVFTNMANVLNNEKIHWTILRNYSELPKNNSSKDVDISIPYSDKERVIKLIEKVMFNSGFKFKKLIKFSFCYSFVYFNVENNDVDSIKIDLFWGLQLRGYTMASSEDIYSTSIDYGLFRGADKSMSDVFNFVTPIISNGVIREKYFQPIVDEFKSNKNDVKRWLSSIMDEEMLVSLESDIKAANIENIYLYIPELRTSILKKTFREQPIKLATNTILRWYFRLIQFITDSGGGFISFHGTDGSGKTTVITEFIKNYCDIFILDSQAISLEHFRPHILPNARAIIDGAKYDESKEEYHNPHRGKNKSFLPSFLALSYYYLDYIAGYFYRTKKEILYHKTVIYDRYIYDVLTDPERLSLTLPYPIRYFFVYITPRPKVSFYLDGPADLIYSRKQELTLEAITIQNKIYNSKLANSKLFTTLDITQSPEKIAIIAIIAYIKKACTELTINEKITLVNT